MFEPRFVTYRSTSPSVARLRDRTGALHEVRVQVAIAVHVEQRHTAAHDLGKQISVAMPGAMDEAESSRGGDFLEPGERAGRRVVRSLGPAAAGNNPGDDEPSHDGGQRG
jgi:hypothetical protein